MTAGPVTGGLGGRGLACERGGRLLFEGLGFSLAPGGALVLRGPNGSGKTSLLRIMAGLARPCAGEVLWDGAPVGRRRDEFRAELAWVGHRDGLKAALTARENLEFHAALGPARPARPAPPPADALDRAGLLAAADLPAGSLSAGQARRLAIARALASPARLWLLDEPATGLDPSAVSWLARAVAGHRAGGGMVAVSANTPLDVPDARRIDLGGGARP